MQERKTAFCDRLVDTMRNGIAVVTFEKVNGDRRTMRCTLKPDLIPENHKPKGDSDRTLNEDVQRVYSVDDNGWRSFRKELVVFNWYKEFGGS